VIAFASEKEIGRSIESRIAKFDFEGLAREAIDRGCGRV
jgi:hypothetical protein